MGFVRGRALGGLGAVGLALAARAGAAGGYQELEFCGRASECERLYLSDAAPTKLCPAPGDRPPRPLWPLAQLQLRIALGTVDVPSEQGWWTMQPKVSRPQLRYTAPARGFCRWTGMTPAALCPECHENPCKLTVREAWGRHSTFDALLPVDATCVYVQKIPDSAVKAVVSWDIYWDPLVVARVLAGLVLVWYWAALRENITLHAGIGGVGSLVFVLALVVVWLFHRLPRGPFGLGTLSLTVVAFVPAAWRALVSLVIPDGSLDWWAWLNVRDPFYDLPVGWIAALAIVLIALGTVTLGANIGMRYFASPPDVTGDVPFCIGADGRRIDELPQSPWPQKFLGWLLWLLGVVLLLFSTHSDAVSLLLLVFALLAGRLEHVWRLWWMQRSITAPGQLRTLISLTIYKEQGRHHTAAALSQLRQHLQARPEQVRRVSEAHELRLRRFSEGGEHVHAPDHPDVERVGTCALL